MSDILVQYFFKKIQKPHGEQNNDVLDKNGIPQCYASHIGS